MQDQLSIRIQFQKNRQDPAEIFEAMALYIKFHTDLGQILFNSINEQISFNFELEDIEKSSLLSKLNPIGLSKKLSDFLIAFSDATLRDIVDCGEDLNSEAVNAIAENIEERIQQHLGPAFPPDISRDALAATFKTLSTANTKIRPDEPVSFIRNGSNVIYINTHQRFKKDDFPNAHGKSLKEILLLNVISPKNKGNAAWGFESTVLNQKFSATFEDKEWLSRYQAQIIPPIGPKDKIKTEVEYFIDKKVNKIINAKIIKIIDIHRAEQQKSFVYE